ncbi:MAG: 1,4-dihydroxy-2-naphthoate octaprenyltransferase, partial [Chloroflexota bacterium]
AARLGPARVTQSGQLAPKTVKRATVLVLVLAAVVSIPVVLTGGWAILIAGLACIAAAVLYTGGPWPFGYHALGDLGAFLFFGPVGVCGTAYVQAGLLTRGSVLNALPVGFLIAAILVVNNLRDIDTDRAVAKRTLAVLLGRRATRAEYVLLLLAAFLVPLARWLLHPSLHWFWLPWLTLPLALLVTRAVLRDEGRKLNQALARTAQLNLLFGAAYALSLLPR